MQRDDATVKLDQDLWLASPRMPWTRAVMGVLHCVLRTVSLLARGRLHQPRGRVGTELRFANGSAARVYRETVIDAPSTAKPCVLVVGFRLRWVHSAWAHWLFRLESELNTVLFAGFTGLRSKLWLRHDGNGVYRGIYQWNDPVMADAYARALWWVLALVSEPASIRHAVIPDASRDEFVAGQCERTDEAIGAGATDDDWWKVEPACRVA
jgi:hypothetical protein